MCNKPIFHGQNTAHKQHRMLDRSRFMYKDSKGACVCWVLCKGPQKKLRGWSGWCKDLVEVMRLGRWGYRDSRNTPGPRL